MKVKIKSVEVLETNLLPFIGMDGPSDYYMTYLQVTLGDGRTLDHNHLFGGTGFNDEGEPYAFTGKNEAYKLAAKVMGRGWIDTAHWTPTLVQDSLEDRLAEEAAMEEMERFAWMSGRAI